jgi:hypothetical protein
VEGVAQHRPQETGLWMRAGPQRAQALVRIALLEDGSDFVGHLAGRRAVIALGQVQHLDFTPNLAVDATAALLAQRPLFDQALQPVRRLEIGMPGVVARAVTQGVDDVCQRIQANHVGRAIGSALGAADQRAGQGIDLIESLAPAASCGAWLPAAKTPPRGWR